MIFKKFLADAAFIGCMLQKFFIIAFNAEVFCNFLPYLPASTSVFTSYCNN